LANLLTLITALGISALTAGQLLDIAEQAEVQATEAMAKHNAHTELLNCYIKTKGREKCTNINITDK
jgi:hypothetical protein